MLICDGHLDLAYNALQGNRNLQHSVYTIRAQEAGNPNHLPPNWGAGDNTVAFPEMRAGKVMLCFGTLLAACSGHTSAHMDYPTVHHANAIAKGQLAYYRNLERAGELRMITDLAALDRHMAEWEAWDAGAEGATPALGMVLSMEGGDPISDPEELDEWWALGLRMLIVTHFGPGRYAGGTGTETGLNEMGRRLLKGMERLGMLVDTTHFSDQAFWEAMDLYGGPVLASHTNSRALVPSQRQFSDEQMRCVIERGGVIGTCLDVWMLQPGWSAGDSNQNISMENVADHIDHVCQLAGNSQHAAIGSDLDGGYGQRQCPRDFQTIADLQKLDAILTQRGYVRDDVANILYRNWVGLLRSTWSR